MRRFRLRLSEVSLLHGCKGLLADADQAARAVQVQTDFGSKRRGHSCLPPLRLASHTVATGFSQILVFDPKSFKLDSWLSASNRRKVV
jgi:hypothetical protein